MWQTRRTVFVLWASSIKRETSSSLIKAWMSIERVFTMNHVPIHCWMENGWPLPVWERPSIIIWCSISIIMKAKMSAHSHLSPLSRAWLIREETAVIAKWRSGTWNGERVPHLSPKELERSDLCWLPSRSLSLDPPTISVSFKHVLRLWMRRMSITQTVWFLRAIRSLFLRMPALGLTSNSNGSRQRTIQ